MDFQFATAFLLAAPLLATLKIILQFFLAMRLQKQRLVKMVKGKHVLVTGGSKGLGKAIAAQLVSAGANVTLFARGVDSLIAAQRELSALNKAVTVHYVSADLSNLDAVVAAVRATTKKMGKVDWLIANAGSAVPGFVAEQLEKGSAQDAMMTQNYFSAVNVVRAIFTVAKSTAETKKLAVGERTWAISGLSMAAQEEVPSKIVLVGSIASSLSFIGYSAYAASKFAQRGYGDALRSELKPLGIDVHVYHPANMDTPGFVVEAETKPEITAQIEGTASTLSADDAAKALLAGIVNKRYLISNDVVGELTRIVANGGAPRPNPFTEAIAAPVLSLAMSGWSLLADMEVRDFFKKAPKQKMATDEKKKT
ncbi:hypothetical protein BJ741DRAFT_660064 [Chytriomyces cf. hyalinus JEL632]|nr:hypothetical protein BJ741DRAFT_660064 [Chytriomyces cf. hyalinus JEL632]